MIYENLYIIGNGFDQHHGIESGFSCFMKWVEDHDDSLFTRLALVYDGSHKSEWWSDFEHNLAQLNVSVYADRKGNLYDPEYINEGSIDEKTEYASKKVIEEFSEIKDSLKHDLQRWLTEACEKFRRDKMIQLLRKQSVFLSFNYTKTLEDYYNIDSKQICHIHGSIDDGDSMLFGHGLGFAELNEIYDNLKPKVIGEVRNKKINLLTNLQIVTPKHTDLAILSSFKSVHSLKKDVDGCIRKNRQFFDEIADVQRIIVYGFSFSSIDLPYLEKIIRCTNPTTHWVVSWYSQGDKERILDFIDKYNIQNITMINEIKPVDAQW